MHLGHLYEHMVCDQIDAFFYRHGLYPYLDYSLTGRILDRGVIFIDIEPYTKEAIKLTKKIPLLDLHLDKETFLITGTQLVAEEERAFGGAGFKAIKNALEELHLQPWKEIDELGIIDTKRIRRKRGVFYTLNNNPMPAKDVVVRISLNPDFARSHRQLLPLFRELTFLMTNVFHSALSGTCGLYSFSSRHSYTRRAAWHSRTFKMASDSSLTNDDVLKVCIDAIKDLIEDNAFHRLTVELQSTSQRLSSRTAPDSEQIFKSLGILIGSKGWQEIATDKNWNLLLSHMAIHVRSRSHTISREDLLKSDA